MDNTMTDSERIIEDEVERLLKDVAAESPSPIAGAGGGGSGSRTTELTTGLLKGVSGTTQTLRPAATPAPFKPHAVEDTSIERFLENGDTLYAKQLKRVTDLRASIDKERSELINEGMAAMRQLKIDTEAKLFQFDQKADKKLEEADHMLRALDALRRTR